MNIFMFDIAHVFPVKHAYGLNFSHSAVLRIPSAESREWKGQFNSAERTGDRGIRFLPYMTQSVRVSDCISKCLIHMCHSFHLACSSRHLSSKARKKSDGSADVVLGTLAGGSLKLPAGE